AAETEQYFTSSVSIPFIFSKKTTEIFKGLHDGAKFIVFHRQVAFTIKVVFIYTSGSVMHIHFAVRAYWHTSVMNHVVLNAHNLLQLSSELCASNEMINSTTIRGDIGSDAFPDEAEISLDVAYMFSWRRDSPMRILFTLQRHLEEEKPPVLDMELMPELVAEEPLPQTSVAMSSALDTPHTYIITPVVGSPSKPVFDGPTAAKQPKLTPTSSFDTKKKRKPSSPTKKQQPASPAPPIQRMIGISPLAKGPPPLVRQDKAEGAAQAKKNTTNSQSVAADTNSDSSTSNSNKSQSSADSAQSTNTTNSQTSTNTTKPSSSNNSHNSQSSQSSQANTSGSQPNTNNSLASRSSPG
uniref:Uncharacterized protein n=1 Tax=Parascaris equorum TaxID=6256 RepID=A0A914RKM2_PAREQ